MAKTAASPAKKTAKKAEIRPKTAEKPVEHPPKRRGRPPKIRPEQAEKVDTKAKATRKKKQEPEITGHWIRETCTKADISRLTGVSIRALTDLDARGILVRGPRNGSYRTIPSLHSYISGLRETAAGRSKELQNPLNDERLLSERADREMKELRLAQLKGEVLTFQEISESWSTFASLVKARLLTVPGKARVQIPHLTAHDGEVLKMLVKDLLNDLSDEIEASVIGGDPKDVKAS